MPLTRGNLPCSFQWYHVECEYVDQETVEQENQYACRTWPRPALTTMQQTDVFFDNGRDGTSSVSQDATLSDHHVLVCIRANRLA